MSKLSPAPKSSSPRSSPLNPEQAQPAASSPPISSNLSVVPASSPTASSATSIGSASSGLLVASRGATLRHGVPHVVHYGRPVELFGMKVAPGDFVLAGSAGALAFPASWLADIPATLREVEARVNPVLAFCRAERRSAAEIQQAITQYMPPPPPENR